MSAERIAEIEKNIALSAPVAETPTEPEPVKAPDPEPVEEAASSEGAEVETEQSTEGGDEPRPPKKKPGVHNRIGELTREKHEAKREADYWRAQALARQGQGQESAPQAQKGNTGEPQLEDFDFDNAKYFRALAKYEATQMLTERDAQAKQQAEQVKQQATQKAFMERAAAFAEHTPEFFDEVFGNSSLPVSDTMAAFIQESEQGPELAWHLRNNPDEARAIFDMDARAADRAMVRIENKLTAESVTAIPERQPANITRAPAVASRVAAAAPGKKAVGDMSVDDHLAAVRAKRQR